MSKCLTPGLCNESIYYYEMKQVPQFMWCHPHSRSVQFPEGFLPNLAASPPAKWIQTRVSGDKKEITFH